MIFIFCALHCEAKPIVEHYALKRTTYTSHPCEIFSNDKVTLAISGVGRMAMAFAVGCLASDIKKSGSVVVNIGSSGSAKESDSQGDLYLINKIDEVATGRQFFPDMLLRSDIQETSLQTFDRPVTDPTLAQHLVDMEASAFAQTVQRLLPSSHTAIIKFVSDKLSMFEFRPNLVTQLCHSNLPAIVAHIEGLDNLAKKTAANIPELSHEEQTLLETVCNNLKLTQYMQLEIKEKVLSYKVRNGSVVAVLEEYAFLEVPNKVAAKNEYSDLVSLLSHSTC